MSAISEIKPKKPPVLDAGFRPIALENRAFLKAVKESGKGVPIAIAVEREKSQIYVYRTEVFAEGAGMDEYNFKYIERLIKSLLWLVGGWKVTVGGHKTIGQYIKNAYTVGGIREFDFTFMGRVYEKEFAVEITDYDKIPREYEYTEPAGRNLDGYRIGFDAGGSDRKVAAVADGEVIFSEEVVWHPKTQSDPDYHYREILAGMKSAAAHLPRVDAIWVSSAGIYVNNRTMVASLFNKVPLDLFNKKIKDIYTCMGKEFGGVPVEVRNDGDVTALAGAMSLNDTKILGIAMGTSEAAGYVNKDGNITGWLNELAFVPIDYNPQAMVCEWSGDYGCGVKYFSQDGVIKLASAANIELKEDLTPAEKLKVVQKLMDANDPRAVKIYETIGSYLGYSIGYYAEFYDIKHLLILGRVTSGEGGNIILKIAEEILHDEFPELAAKIKIHLPDESNRRVGQAIAAASLPVIKKKVD
jgi:predicted NBD/HSP70 family sugar kinase